MHSRLQECLPDCIFQGNVPGWMVSGRIVLIQKDTAKGAQASNYRPIDVEALDRSYGRDVIPHLERNGLLTDGQTDYKKAI